MNRKKAGPNLGASLKRDKARKKRAPPQNFEFKMFYSTDIERSEEEKETNKLSSQTQINPLTEFVQNAEMANSAFVVEKQNLVVLTRESFIIRTEPTEKQKEMMQKHWNDLKVPRRPKWDYQDTSEIIDRKERDAFLAWRRELADLEQNEDLIITPFEKNLEVWRQLWRVVEKSDIVVQIVDARNPLIRCLDLERYSLEVDPIKKNLLLVNKSDLLTKKQRLQWANYFKKEGVNYMFWSAYAAQIKIEEREEQEKVEAEQQRLRELAESRNHLSDNEDSDEDEDSEEDSEEEKKVEKKEDFKPKQTDDVDEYQYTEEENKLVEIRSTDEFIALCLELCKGLDKKVKPPPPNAKINSKIPKSQQKKFDENEIKPYVIGMVGYPNVGKSSTINVLCGEKRVAVSLTPGKTKRLQTISLSPQITLCDCPGLVFPSFLQTKSEMIVGGLLPIDHMKDSRPPTALICNRIPRWILEKQYGIILPEPRVDDGEDPNRFPFAHELLQAYARIRGFFGNHGVPDESRAARIILKDYVSGTLLYVHPAPGLGDEFKQWWVEGEQPHALSKKIKQLPSLRDKKSDAAANSHVNPKKKKAIDYEGLDRMMYEQQRDVGAFTKGKKAGSGAFTRVQYQHSPVPLAGRGRARRGRGRK